MHKTIHCSDITTNEVQHFLNHAIAPRPICFASTIDSRGNSNLSPFSYFNVFSVNPPVIVFSPSTRVRDNTPKHTFLNLQEIPEVAVNIVTYDMIQQVNLSSCDYPKDTDEFVKAGFSKEPSHLIRPFRVRESPVQLECKVTDIRPLGENGGAGNLVIAEVMLIHIDDRILTEAGTIDQRKLDLAARLGGNWYARINNSNLFEVPRPNQHLGIGIDELPPSIKNSAILSGNHLGILANIAEIPMVDASFEDEKLTSIFQYYSVNPDEMEQELHRYAAVLLGQRKVSEAWQVLLSLAGTA